MATEIERKFLLTNDAWRAVVKSSSRYRQGYLANTEGGASVRVRVAGDQAALNIKGMTLGIQRPEYEYSIPVTDAEEMLDNLCIGPVISKTRYFVEHEGYTWEIDIFEGDNAGLVVAEIELSSVDEVFSRPDWLGEEVSHDPRYYNVRLVTHPYKDWPEAQ